MSVSFAPFCLVRTAHGVARDRKASDDATAGVFASLQHLIHNRSQVRVGCQGDRLEGSVHRGVLAR